MTKRIDNAFTLIELLVVISIIALLIALLIPALSRAREIAAELECSSNMRNLGVAIEVFANESDDYLPPRSRRNRWPNRLREGYRDKSILACPADIEKPATQSHDPRQWPFDAAPRSYTYNGFNDYFEEVLTPEKYKDYMAMRYDYGIRRSDLEPPSTIIVFGEKKSESWHYYMDFLQGAGNDVTELEHTRHLRGKGNAGRSNYTFGDGHVETQQYGESLSPINKWAVSEKWRHGSKFNLDL